MSAVDALVTRLTQANDAYRNNHPIMSDAAYDKLEDELRALDPQHPFLNKIGATPNPTSGWQKAPHSRPMASLNKAQEQSDFEAWLRSCGFRPGELLIVMDKLDGASLALVYENGSFVQAITRGDGVTGEDITTNAKVMPFPKVIPNQFTGSLRGEVIVRYQAFKDQFPGQSNPRNTANGTMKRQSDQTGCRYLDVVMFDVLPANGPVDDKSEQFRKLKVWGFSTPKWSLTNSLSDVLAVYQEYITNIRSSVADHKPGDGKLDYDVDGLVIQFDNVSRFEGLGDQGRGPKGAIAFKFPHEEKETFLRNVRWQVGNSGRITPVAEFDQVILGGANVVQASLHNISNMAALAGGNGQEYLFSGDKILVARRNDVIPYVEAVLSDSDEDDPTPFKSPTSCPCCAHKTERDGEYLVCRNEECSAQVAGAVKRWVKKIGVLHVGDSLIECLIDAGMVEDPADLYTLDATQVANLTMGQRRVGGTADKAITNLRKSMELELHILVGSLGIPGVGRSTVQKIVEAGHDSLQKMLLATAAEISAIPGVGAVKGHSFAKGYYEKLWLITKLLGNGITVKKKITGRFTGKTALVTGFRGLDEKVIVDAFTAEGGEMKSSVSTSLTYLICRDKSSQSGKTKKALSYNSTGKGNITIEDIDGFWSNVMQRPRP